MERFVALCSPEFEFHLKSFQEFAGRINPDPNKSCGLLNINDIPDDVSTIRIGPGHPPFYRLLADNPKVLEKRNIVIGLHCLSDTPRQINLHTLATIGAENSNKVDIIRALESWIYLKKFNQGPLTHGDAIALLDLTLNQISKADGQFFRILEVGSALGTSSVALARAIQISGISGHLYCVDPWEIFISPPLRGLGSNRQNDCFDSFDTWNRITRMMCVHEITKPLKMLSDEAFELFADEIFDIVFLDGEHRYDGFFRDIRNSIRVLKPGGMLIGHDSECYAHKCNEKFLIDNKDSYHGARRHDGKIIHTGVVLALRDLFGRNFEIYRDSSVWHKVVNSDDKNQTDNLFPQNYFADS